MTNQYGCLMAVGDGGVRYFAGGGQGVASRVDPVSRCFLPGYWVGVTRKTRGVSAAYEQTGSLFLRLEVSPTAGGIPGSRRQLA